MTEHPSQHRDPPWLSPSEASPPESKSLHFQITRCAQCPTPIITEMDPNSVDTACSSLRSHPHNRRPCSAVRYVPLSSQPMRWKIRDAPKNVFVLPRAFLSSYHRVLNICSISAAFCREHPVDALPRMPTVHWPASLILVRTFEGVEYVFHRSDLRAKGRQCLLSS
ncbi:hypothetical protein BC834DRAFT_589802 [Gloeopeniophorella convolvens]|nr:hypothetical protein BC834DRAFT_589802 [Gloeopeniophorella convolvens]